MGNESEKLKVLVPVDLKNIILNENAYFYSLKEKITNKDITTFFKDSLANKNAKRRFKSIIREPFFDGSKAIATYSLDIFEFKRKPPFLKESEQGILESKYGLFFILEFEGYVAIIKKYVSGVKSLYSVIEGVDYQVLAHFLITNKSKIEKIVTNNMNTAENAVQRKITEAVDLKGILSRFGASKQILNSIRLDNDGEKQTVALNTSRVNSFKLKNDFNQVVFWMINVLKLIKQAYKNLPTSSFIDGFATPLKFEDVINTLQPTYVLLRFGTLKDEIEAGKIEKCYKKGINDEEIKIDLLEVIKNNDRLFQLTKFDDRTYVSKALKLKINEKSITISDPDWKEIILDYGQDSTMTLNQYLNYGNNFLVNFDKIDHVYANRKIFKDSKLLGDLDNFFNAFITYPELSKIDSEKGKNYKITDTKFKSKSLFEFVENRLAHQADILICDDNGTEWGDFIAINTDEIAFYHAKYNEKGLSATHLEEVFGQAQKNFGALELTDEMIEYRKNRWTSAYRLNKVQTKINRIRKCPISVDKIKTIKETVNNVSSNPNLRRKVFVVINFISKAELKKSIGELKKGNTFTHTGVTLQILWFVNSLLSSANELNTELRIICQE